MTEVAAPAITEAEATAYRNEFPIFDHTTYLNNCSLGPLSRGAMYALEQYQADWSQYGAPVWWRTWLGQIDAAKERFARLIGASPHEVTVSHSISSALASIASTFDYTARPAVVCADLDFPTISYQWLAKAHRGVQVRFVRSADGIQVPIAEYERWLGSDVSVLATSHGFYTTGYTQPIRQLSDLAHANGAKIVVDGYHSVGVHPVDVKALDVDFYVGGTLKWLLGGPGLTFIYVREDLIERLQPDITGWFASNDQFAFDTHHLAWPSTADRLELGTPAMGTVYSGIAGMDMILAAKPERIYPRLQELTGRIVARAQQAGYTVRSPLNPEERGGIVMLEVPQPRETVDCLFDRHFTVDYRPGLVRLSPHFFNTMNDVDRLMDELDAVQSELA